MSASLEIGIASLTQMTISDQHAQPQVSSEVAEAGQKTVGSPKIKAEVEGLNFFYGKLQALKNINMGFNANQVTAIILSLIHISEPTRPY